MPNKTIYVKDSDLHIWDAAQKEMGESMSALFSQFLRERVRKMDAFVHVIHSEPLGSSHYTHNFAVMIAPVGPTGSGRGMSPRYLNGKENLLSYLIQIGVTEDSATRTELDLRTQNSVSLRTEIYRSELDNTGYYRLRFKPVRIQSASGEPILLKVDLIGSPLSGGPDWHASHHTLSQLIHLLGELGFLPAQLGGFQNSLLAGVESELGGHGGPGVQHLFTPQQLMQLGMVEGDV
jgi:hypothetical protein